MREALTRVGGAFLGLRPTLLCAWELFSPCQLHVNGFCSVLWQLDCFVGIHPLSLSLFKERKADDSDKSPGRAALHALLSSSLVFNRESKI